MRGRTMLDSPLPKISCLLPNDPPRRLFVIEPIQNLQFSAYPAIAIFAGALVVKALMGRRRLAIGESMANGYDERCAADLANVVEGRRLSRKNACWLACAIIGAIRPNRDKPLPQHQKS
jgi:hypothetical protein